MEYLRLKDEWIIRGTKEIPRLYNWHNNKTIKLNNDVLKYILLCNGTKSIEDICTENGLSFDEAKKFYDQFRKADALEDVEFINERRISVNLGMKEPWLKEVHLDVTDNCNLRCRHCFWGENITCNKNVEAEVWKNTIIDLKNNGVGKVVISGGEALTREDLLEIIKSCYENEIFIGAIFTNGTVKGDSTEAVIDFIIKNKLETSFYVSMDGFLEEQHDFIRGKGKFKDTLEFVQMLVKKRKKEDAKYRILINSLIHRKNYTKLIEWYDFLNALGVDSWRFTTGRITGTLIKNVSEIKVKSSEYFPEYIKLTKYAIEKYREGMGINLNVENYFNTRYLERGKVLLFNKDFSICDYKSNACSIDPYGNVQFCTGWQDTKYGNVFEKSISEIWYSDKLQKMKSYKISKITECSDCEYLKYCGGGCRLECKNLQAKDDYVCENFRLFAEYMIPILEEQKLEFVEA